MDIAAPVLCATYGCSCYGDVALCGSCMRRLEARFLRLQGRVQSEAAAIVGVLESDDKRRADDLADYLQRLRWRMLQMLGETSG